ncbi:hypothetical protein WJM97_03085 [Okeanomitos corallinicola TIOX110]|uniref:Uncharacterized protein n=1 Tax=Okeanomitos corallinicola TIOX110 TaxID=3133117 RepID=A0ABZ2UTP6_9CYAN
MFKKLRGSLFVGIGYMLSPLSWWNDVFFNLPIALLFGYLVSWAKPDWFLPFTVIGYWLSNVLGIVMMQMGAMDMFFQEEKRNVKRDLILGLGGSTLYTIVVALLVYFHILEVPDFLVDLR